MTDVYKPDNSFRLNLKKKQKLLKFDKGFTSIVEKIQNKYKIEQSLGEGNFAILFLGK